MGIYLSRICFFWNYIWQIPTLHLVLVFLSCTWFEVYFRFFPNHFHWDPVVFYPKQVHPSIQSTENLMSLYEVQEHPLLVVIAVVQAPNNFKKTHFYIQKIYFVLLKVNYYLKNHLFIYSKQLLPLFMDLEVYFWFKMIRNGTLSRMCLRKDGIISYLFQLWKQHIAGGVYIYLIYCPINMAEQFL